MNYSDLVSLPKPGTPVPALTNPAPDAPRGADTGSYSIFEQEPGAAAYVFIPPGTQLSETTEHQGIIIATGPGLRESDVMLVVSAIAECLDLGKGRWQIVQAVGSLAGEFRILEVHIGSDASADSIRSEIMVALEWSDFDSQLPDLDQVFQRAFPELIESFFQANPNAGLLISLVPEGGTSGTAGLAFAVSTKTPEQRNRVREHLSRFAPSYARLRKQLEVYVASFPLHPDYVRLLGQISLPGKPGIRDTARAAIKARLETPLSAKLPGLIGWDHYWEELLTHPGFRGIPEVEAVVNTGKRAEQVLARAFKDSPDKELATRVLRTLCVHRLTTLDLYTHQGMSLAALQDALSLFEPGRPVVPSIDETPSARLRRVLAKVQAHLGSRLLGFEQRRGEYFLRFSKFRRFVLPELVLHWANAVPFLVLLASGGAMLGSRFWPVSAGVFQSLVAVHKGAAVSWLLLVPLTVLSRVRVHWRHISEMLRWGREDLIWVVQTLRSLQNKHAHMAPAGRFNTGQKINACLVMLYFVGFGGTGLLMWLKGSILVPWYVHTALYFSAMGSVGGHLFLALINPNTRIALAGIFHGWSPIEYVEHHHALSLPVSLRKHHFWTHGLSLLEELLGSRKELALLGVLALLIGLNVAAFNHWRLDSIKKKFAKSFADCIQPGELSTRHRLGSGAAACTKCHSFTGEIPNRNCESCHAYIKVRRENAIGYHGTLKGDCFQCHKEHPARRDVSVPLQRDKFDHSLAAFPREGRHAQVVCNECHLKQRPPGRQGIYYLGLKHDSCRDCHADSHGNQFAQACQDCHSPAGWTGKNLVFNHTNAAFRLSGKHSSVACAKCHQTKKAGAPFSSAVFKGTTGKCAGCHNEPHRNQFAAECSACHSTLGWQVKELVFEHNRDSSFKLTGKHAAVACAKCHTPSRPGDGLGFARFRGLKSACADCHNDPHRGQFERACTKCHESPATWEVGAPVFEHSRDTKYPLQGKHTSVECIKCHKPLAGSTTLASAKFAGLDTHCAQCHSVEHPPQYGSNCSACHTFSGWPKKKAPLDHVFKQLVAGENLVGKHLAAKCKDCHNGLKVKPRQGAQPIVYECVTCHESDEPHKSVLGRNCSKCHGMDGWKGDELRFSHETMASFSLDQAHQKLACSKCHENGHWKPIDSKCESCHTQRFLDGRK